MPLGEISDHDYCALAELRHQIRRFLRLSEQAARDAGLEPQQHQLLLAVRGMPDGQRCTIGEVAERLQIQHHSTVELVDRLVKRGYVLRRQGGEDRREVMLMLTPKGEKALRELALYHREELRTAGPALVAALRKMMSRAPSPRLAGRKPPARAAAAGRGAGSRRNSK
jgi:DNA-binding MarR family transcriptional regulator